MRLPVRLGPYYPQSARQDNVFFCPAMNLLAMRADELGRFHFGSSPKLFVDGLTGHCQFRSRGAANQESLNDGASFYFSHHRCSKKFHFFILEAVDDARLVNVVRRHLEFDAIANGKSNKSFAHFSGNVRQDKMLVGQSDPEHGAGKNRHDRSFQLEGFF